MQISLTVYTRCDICEVIDVWKRIYVSFAQMEANVAKDYGQRLREMGWQQWAAVNSEEVVSMKTACRNCLAPGHLVKTTAKGG